MIRRRHRDGQPEADNGRSKGVGLAIGGVVTMFFIALPFVMVVALYLFLTTYAVVRAIGSAQHENGFTIGVGFALLTSALAVFVSVITYFVGRSLTPRKRRRTE